VAGIGGAAVDGTDCGAGGTAGLNAELGSAELGLDVTPEPSGDTTSQPVVQPLVVPQVVSQVGMQELGQHVVGHGEQDLQPRQRQAETGSIASSSTVTQTAAILPKRRIGNPSLVLSFRQPNGRPDKALLTKITVALLCVRRSKESALQIAQFMLTSPLASRNLRRVKSRTDRSRR
jgi:hypothetical protein